MTKINVESKLWTGVSYGPEVNPSALHFSCSWLKPALLPALLADSFASDPIRKMFHSGEYTLISNSSVQTAGVSARSWRYPDWWGQGCRLGSWGRCWRWTWRSSWGRPPDWRVEISCLQVARAVKTIFERRTCSEQPLSASQRWYCIPATETIKRIITITKTITTNKMKKNNESLVSTMEMWKRHVLKFIPGVHHRHLPLPCHPRSQLLQLKASSFSPFFLLLVVVVNTNVTTIDSSSKDCTS